MLITIYDHSEWGCVEDYMTDFIGPPHPNYIKLVVPSIREVCSRCNGEGVHDHPAFSNGISSEEWSQWVYEEREEYMRGTYDVRCEECNGNKVVDEPNWDLMTEWQRELADKYYQEQNDYYAERDAERRMGA